MKVTELAKRLDAEIISPPAIEIELEGGYCGDFLSFVMQRAPENTVWFTVMTNINVAAVASLINVGAVVICEGCKSDELLIERMKSQGICLMETKLDIFGAVKEYLK